ncbi:MAG: transcriptional repressor [Gammaproteobacteria bacterium]|nr:transcriptional repressor [Gammaproteobacteria bacterium]
MEDLSKTLSANRPGAPESGAESGRINAGEIRRRLEAHGILPTAQRIDIASILFAERGHYSAEDVYNKVNHAAMASIANGFSRKRASKATVYNTLGLFAEKGLVKEVIADPDRVFFDTYTGPHHHMFNTDTGELKDIDGESVNVIGLPALPEGAELESIELIVRWHQKK